MLPQTQLSSYPESAAFVRAHLQILTKPRGWGERTTVHPGKTPVWTTGFPCTRTFFFFLKVHKKSHKAFIYNCPRPFSTRNRRYGCCPLRTQGEGGPWGQAGSGQDCRWPHAEHPGLWAGGRAEGSIFIEFYKRISKVTSIMYADTLTILKGNQKGDICPSKYKRPYKSIIIETMLSPQWKVWISQPERSFGEKQGRKGRGKWEAGRKEGEVSGMSNPIMLRGLVIEKTSSYKFTSYHSYH